MSNNLDIYNFLPPIDQYVYPGDSTNTPSGIGQNLDSYLPSYTLTTGDLQPLLSTNGVTGQPINIIGTAQTGSTGGLGGYPPPATPFMMMTYSQVTNLQNTPSSNGIVQMVLLKANSQTIQSIITAVENNNPGALVDNTGFNTVDKTTDMYCFAPFNDIIDEDAIAKVYYNIDTSVSPQTIRFYDADLVAFNPTDDISEYMLFSVSAGDYGGRANTYAFWPTNKNYVTHGDDDPHLMNMEFQFNEFINQVNVNETHLKSGKFYHPYHTKMTYNDDISKNSGYTEYGNTGSYKYFSGYGPGYPVNINYISTVINNTSIPSVRNGTDNRINQFNLQFPVTTNLSVYNFNYNKASNFATGSNFYDIVDVNGKSAVLYNNVGCSSNNECYSSDNSYFANNFNTIQAGIAQYMTYQFIPFKHIKPPTTNIVTDYTQEPGYAYITLPENINFTPSSIGPGGSTGSFPIQTVELISVLGSTAGATGSLISNWMLNPNNDLYQCSNAVSNFSYCGFIDYYDSLNAIAYDYGLCGATGLNQNAFQKGACPSNQVCVPNFIYSTNRNPYFEPIYLCVPETEGVTTQNMQYFIDGFPNQGQGGYTSTYPIYNAPPLSNPDTNFENAKKTSKSENSIFLWIAIFVGVVLILFVIYALITSFKKKSFYEFDKSNMKT